MKCVCRVEMKAQSITSLCYSDYPPAVLKPLPKGNSAKHGSQGVQELDDVCNRTFVACGDSAPC